MPVESDPDYSAAVLEKTLYFNEKISEADAKLAVRKRSEKIKRSACMNIREKHSTALSSDLIIMIIVFFVYIATIPLNLFLLSPLSRRSSKKPTRWTKRVKSR